MKLLLILITVFSGLTATFAAGPPPPTMIGQVGAPTGGFWLTNVTFVYTNAAVRTPTIDLGQVTVYATNTLDKATILSWTPPTNTVGLAGYKLYYGQTGSATTNKFAVTNTVTCAIFYSSMATNTTWWAYVTCVDTANVESVPSAQILFAPR